MGQADPRGHMQYTDEEDGLVDEPIFTWQEIQEQARDLTDSPAA